MNRADVFHSVRPGRRAVPAMKGSAGSFDPARSALRSGRKRTGAGMRKGVSIGFALLVLMVPLGACKREDPQAAVQAEAAQAAAAEQAAMQVEQQFAAAVAKQDWSLARGYGEVLLMDHPGTKAAARVEAQLVDVRAKVAEADSQARLRALWSYQTEPVKGGNQLSASIFAKAPVDAGGGARQVRLIFRDHPDWAAAATSPSKPATSTVTAAARCRSRSATPRHGRWRRRGPTPTRRSRCSSRTSARCGGWRRTRRCCASSSR